MPGDVRWTIPNPLEGDPVAEKSVALEIAWHQRIGAGFFGGGEFILQNVTGPGVVWLDLSGELVERDLASGEQLVVHAGHVGMFERTVGFDIQTVREFRMSSSAARACSSRL